MKLNKKSMLRICSLIAAVVILASITIVPASAATYDFLDYMQNIRIDHDLNMVVVQLPMPNSRIDISPSNMDQKESFFVNSFIYPFMGYSDAGVSYDVTVSPSWSGSRVNFLSLENIPNNTMIYVYLSLQTYTGQRPSADTLLNPYEDFQWSSSGGRFFYYKDSEHIKTSRADFDYLYTDYSGTPYHTFQGAGVLQDPEAYGAIHFTTVNRMYPNFYLNGLTFNESCNVKIDVLKYEILFEIDTLVAEGKTNGLLTAINDKLVAEGLYIDPITGDITNIKPGLGEDDNLLNDSNDKFKEDYSGFDSFDDAMLGLQEIDVESFDTDIRNLVDPESFLAVISPFREIWNYQPFASILLIVVSLIVISLVFFGKRG